MRQLVHASARLSLLAVTTVWASTVLVTQATLAPFAREIPGREAHDEPMGGIIAICRQC
jgi:hypothetical protein